MASGGDEGSSSDGQPIRLTYNVEGAREREMHMFYPYWGIPPIKKRSANASRDNVLTVFAQLATLRLKAKRALISLFDRTTQYVVAEATPRYDLRRHEDHQQDSNAKAKSGNLWLGVCQMSREHMKMCDHAMQSFVENPESMFMVRDLSQDPRFHDHPSVAGHPHNRFYVAVPIVSPGKHVIGNFVVIDDKPRDGLSEEDTTCIRDLALTVIDHLQSQRAMREEYREEKMVKALALFVNGKSDLGEWGQNQDGRPTKNPGGALVDMSEVRNRLDDLKSPKETGESSPEEDNPEGKEDDLEHQEIQSGQQAQSQLQQNRVSSKTFNDQDQDDTPMSPKGTRRAHAQGRPTRPKLSPTTSRLQESLVPSNVRTILSRASNLIHQALDVEGTMFLDASVYARRQMMGSTSDLHEDRNPSPRKSSGDSSQLTPRKKPARDQNLGSATLVLGHSTNAGATQSHEPGDRHYVSLSSELVSRIIDRYSRGKIFHVDADGTITMSYEGTALSSELETHVRGESGGKQGKAPHDAMIQEENRDISDLIKVMPGARCIAIFPLWDFQRNRWFAVNVVWTRDPGRVLSEPKDLTYMAAFSNSVMAEISRLNLQAADRAKADFISSISHELRSPLHGILGTLELLNDTATSVTQRPLLETVSSCGKTLLDTLNNLLDYGKMNALNDPQGSQKHNEAKNDEERRTSKSAGPPEQEEDLSLIVQEVVEGLVAGQDFFWRSTETKPEKEKRAKEKKAKGNLKDVITIVDIQWQESWLCKVNPGAWRRVIMNLFGNALKYTEKGCIRLRMENGSMLLDNEKVPAVRVVITDSGRGMSEDYILHHLYTAFVQEDTMSPGLGVGVHIVNQIVKSMSGQIEFNSELGVGTEVSLLIPVTMINDEPRTSLASSRYTRLKERLHGRTVALFTDTFRANDLKVKPEFVESIVANLRKMISDWFGLRVLTASELDGQSADINIITQDEYSRHHLEEESESGALSPTSSASIRFPLIVLSANATKAADLSSDRDDVVFFYQPVSPKSLALAFETCLDIKERSSGDTTPDRMQTTPSPPPSDPTPLPEPAINGSHAQTAKSTKIKGSGEKPAASPQDSPVVDFSDDQAGQRRQPNTGSGPRKVLLVEDNAINLQLLEMAVRKSSFQYHSVSNGLEASEAFRRTAFDAVVMDISMPVMNGLEATRKIRQWERAQGLEPTVIIILTAGVSPDIQQEARASGVNLFLMKPISIAKLQGVLRDMPDAKKGALF
ncbi:sensor histidine kinase/response regulator [Aspergillus saccharolyticus JOP 1030-1]|uniref:Sensor histidine kinase/response regulator n=1 Tax=Aspergillus saccharolyticus JOP 1030-1 TaxID=1450539 RepID=A0A318Z8A2_9EURO|nr:sensor histidine kinase/response regulator [Aspergillus saccharolyticus JOP 1030-1]PYH43456.1 sensor histidine kinase/response regulator [Aspergillus saccharolyticus JOP 1030-1]